MSAKSELNYCENDCESIESNNKLNNETENGIQVVKSEQTFDNKRVHELRENNSHENESSIGTEVKLIDKDFDNGVKNKSQYKCGYYGCNEMVDNKYMFAKHLTNHRNNCECFKCGQSFVSSHELCSHITNAHKNNKRKVCDKFTISDPKNEGKPKIIFAVFGCNQKSIKIPENVNKINDDLNEGINETENAIQLNNSENSETQQIFDSNSVEMKTSDENLICEQNRDIPECDGKRYENNERKKQRKQVLEKNQYLSVEYNVEKCEVCRQVFDNKRALDIHAIKCHKNEFLVKNELKLFTEIIDKDIRDKYVYVCDFYECNEQFVDCEQLKTHKGIHPQNFDCVYCGRSFKRSVGLNIHIKAIHKELRFNCDLCDFKTIQKQFYDSHMKCHEYEEQK